LSAHFAPQRVTLFGSAARGEAGPDSDIDLLVVVDDDTPPEILGARSVLRGAPRLSWRRRHLAVSGLGAGGAGARKGLVRRHRAARGRDGV
jgi:hypothetical protein